MDEMTTHKMKFRCWLRTFFLTFGLFCLFGSYAFAQNVRYTQYHLSPVQTNPAAIATSNQMQAVLNYRSQTIGSGTAYVSPMASFTMPWLKGGYKRKGALGLSFLQDRTGEGGLLNTTGGILTAAANFNLTPVSAEDSSRRFLKYISIGIQGGFFQRRVDENALTTGEQWNGEVFDPSIAIGEQSELFNANVTFPIINFGAMFYMADACGNQKASLGFNIQSINQPNTAFFSEADPNPMYFTAHGAYSFELSPMVSLKPNFRLVREKNSQEIRLGTMTYYNFLGGGGFIKEGNVGAGLWYDSNGSVVMGIEVNQPNYFVGFSYDMGASQDFRDLGGGAIEFSLGVKFGKKCREKGPPKLQDPILDTTVLEVKTAEGDSLYTIVARIDGISVIDTDTIDRDFIPNPVTEKPDVSTEKLFKRKAFFYYLSDNINKATAKLLDNIVGTLKKYPDMRVKVIGHTCTIGKDNYNLSVRRAQAVVDYLMSKGVSQDRLVLEAHGDTKPLLSNKTEYGRIKNRRVEFELIK